MARRGKVDHGREGLSNRGPRDPAAASITVPAIAEGRRLEDEDLAEEEVGELPDGGIFGLGRINEEAVDSAARQAGVAGNVA